MQLRINDPALRECYERLIAVIREAGGRVLVVGGGVRDALLGFAAKDLDLEVYGLSPEALRNAVSALVPVDLVGAAFGVLKVRGVPIDISIPRRESKSGLGHKGFDVLSDGNMTHREAAARRDFTINAVGFDPQTGELIDPFEGAVDLQKKVLRHTSEKFAEDPLRVLRAMQFAARFDFDVAPETVALCRTIEPEGLPNERIFEEWKKLILRGIRPSRGLQFLRDCGWIRYYPELEALIGCEQEPEWHPEGDVWAHTLHCLDAFARGRTGDDREDLIVGLGVLCHDLGKPMTTEVLNGRIRSYDHEIAGEAPTRSFLARLTHMTDLADEVVPLVLEHMRPVELYEAGASDNAVRRLAARVKRIDRLVRVARADQMGRPPMVLRNFPAGDWLLERARAQAIESNEPKPIMMGRHLLQMGLVPGPQFSMILDACYQGQLDGRITSVEEGVRFVREMFGSGEISIERGV